MLAHGQIRFQDLVVNLGGSVDWYSGNFTAVNQPIIDGTDHADASLEQVTKLVWNIESWGRYRVFELRWQLHDKKQNSEAPFNKLRKPVIKVGYRQPLTKGQ